MRDLLDGGDASGPGADPGDAAAARWRDALAAAALLAVDPCGLGGAWLRAGPGQARDAWLAALRRLMPAATPWQRLPMGLGVDALSCGQDLGAMLATGRSVDVRGPAARADGGVLLLPGAEALDPAAAGALAQTLDTGRAPGAPGSTARIALVALDEAAGEGEGLAPALADRLAFPIALDAIPLAVTEASGPLDLADIAGARARLPAVTAPDELLETLTVAALRYGVGSLRAVLHALRAARAQAAILATPEIDEAAAAAALRLVLLPRATRLPEPSQEDTDEEEAPPPPPSEDHADSAEQPSPEDAEAMADRLIEAVAASLPPDALAALAGMRRGPTRSTGATGARSLSLRRGRPAGVTQGVPGHGRRLALAETLAAAAPWQRVRARPDGARLAIRRSDLRLRRFKTPRETLTVFAVDASGSAALARMAEAKGAVELMLAEAYRRRDHVALVAFRGAGAEVLLPPTRALARARRALAGLPGGGATPLAAGIEAATALALDARRRGQGAQVVYLTDGKANMGRDGTPGRGPASADAERAARAAAQAGVEALVIDSAARPGREARALADAMAARYLALPGARAETIARAAGAGR